MARHRSRLGSRSASSAPTVAAAIVAILVGGCELAVPSTISSFTCTPGPGACPGDAICAPSTGQCVALSHACTTTGCPHGEHCDSGSYLCVPDDGGSGGDGTDGDGPPPDRDAGDDARADVGPDSGACRGFGCKCSGAGDCDSDVCSDPLTVTQDIYNAAGKINFCTQPCCTSADCPSGTVCFGTGAGGSYCVKPSWVSRATPSGSKTGGSQCGGDAECRSGLCDSSFCQDTCCSTFQASSECGGGDVCRIGGFPGRTFDTHWTAHCGAKPGSGGDGANCFNNSDCTSDFCSGGCVWQCRNSGDCTGGTGNYCAYALNPQNSAVLPICSQTSGKPVCFTNDDCKVNPGNVCRPEIAMVQGGGSVSVLLCGPR